MPFPTEILGPVYKTTVDGDVKLIKSDRIVISITRVDRLLIGIVSLFSNSLSSPYQTEKNNKICTGLNHSRRESRVTHKTAEIDIALLGHLLMVFGLFFFLLSVVVVV